MKKYKIHFALSNLFTDSQAEIVKLQTYVKTGTAFLAASAWMTSSPTNTLMVSAVGFVCDAILHCLYLEEIK
jgi:hypothetical protein